MTASVEHFWSWFRSRSESLALQGDAAVADQLHEALSLIDSTLWVEVATDRRGGQPIKEVLVFSPDHEGGRLIVESIVRAAPKDSRWRFAAQRPPRGFQFTYERDGVDVDASRLFFDPMESSQRPDLIGVLIYCPDELAALDSIVDIMWQIVRTGLGDHQAQSIAVIKVQPASKRPDGALPMDELGRYVAWRSARTKPS